MGYVDKKDLGNSQSSNLEFSRVFYAVENTNKNFEEKKEMINEKVKQGFFPLFMKLNENKPQFMFVKNIETKKSALEIYKSLMGLNNDNKEYTLYNQHNKKLLPQDVPIKDLNLKYFSFISNNI